eukprot:5417322-Amphidinium_carterae.2
MQQDFEGIIPDIGAITNLCGKEQLDRVERLGAKVQRRFYPQNSSRSWWKLTRDDLRDPRNRSEVLSELHHC